MPYYVGVFHYTLIIKPSIMKEDVLMAFMDKLKETAGKAAEKANNMKDSAKDSIGKMKEANGHRRAEKQAYIEAMEKETNEYSQALIDSIIDNYSVDGGAFWGDGDRSDIEKFTKEYYEKLVLPGSRPNIACLTMHPYIDEKAMKKFSEKGGVGLQGSVPRIFIRDGKNFGIVVTSEFVAFKFKYEKDNGFWVNGMIPVESINTLNVEIGETSGSIMINGVKLVEIKIKGSYRQDFISLNYFFECIRKQDFTIDGQEVNDQIRAKLGEKIYSQVKKYFIDDDELLLFYAGGIDSLTAVDYIACTNNQLIFVNREMLGATANVKQFYFEDVTSMATIQNTKADDLFVAVVDTALTAVLKICNLEVSVAGSKEVIDNIYLLEGTRIISIYHEMRKKAKKAAAQPVQIAAAQPVQIAAAQPDVFEQLEKLSKLKDAGIISEEEFAPKKMELLSRL